MRFLGILVLCIIVLACPISQDECNPLDGKPSFPVEKADRIIKTTTPVNGTAMQFVVANNPYCLKSDDRLIVFMGESCVFHGSFSLGGTLKVPSDIFNEGNTHVRLYIVRGEEVYVFQDKSIIPIDKKDKYLYVCFFPSNQDIDQIHFFPQEYACIQ